MANDKCDKIFLINFLLIKIIAIFHLIITFPFLGINFFFSIIYKYCPSLIFPNKWAMKKEESSMLISSSPAMSMLERPITQSISCSMPFYSSLSILVMVEARLKTNWPKMESMEVLMSRPILMIVMPKPMSKTHHLGAEHRHNYCEIFLFLWYFFEILWKYYRSLRVLSPPNFDTPILLKKFFIIFRW